MAEEPGLREAVDALIAQNERDAADKVAARAAKKADLAAQGLTAQAALMRERRKRPEIRAAEQAADRANLAAQRRLQDSHSDEFLRYVQEERQARGLGLLVQRKARQVAPGGSTKATPAPKGQAKPADAPRAEKTPAVVLEPKPLDVQAQCPHNGGLRKQMYGTFCQMCGKRIR